MNGTLAFEGNISQTKRWPEVVIDSGVLLSTLLVIGIIFGNILIIIVASSKRKVFQSKATCTLITSLAVVDLEIGLFFAVNLPNIVFQRWMYGSTACKLQAMSGNLLCGLETQIIALISLERYLAICRPLHYHHILNKKTYITVISLLGAVACGFTIFPPLAGIDYELSTAVYVCVMNYNNVTGQIYFMAFAVVACGLPITIVVITNVRIVHAIRRQRNLIHASNREQNQPARIDKGSLVSIMLVVIIFFTLAPIVITSSINYYLHSNVRLFWPALIMVSNSFWNIFVYIFWNKLFRRGFIQIMCCR